MGRVLHVGTSHPRMMVITVDTCMGPRAYAGVGYAYHEKIAKDFERLTDEQWGAAVEKQAPDSPGWLGPVLGQ